MPIRPEHAVRYPKDWKAISLRIRQRAGWCCEGSPAFPYCRRPNNWLLNTRTGVVTDDPMQAEAWALADGDKVTRIVLTVAHLDNAPENCSDDNLRAWCQRCHLNYDIKIHMRNAYETRRKNRRTLELDL